MIPSAYDSKLKFKRMAYTLLILYHSLSRPFNYYLIELQCKIPIVLKNVLSQTEEREYADTSNAIELYY